MNIVLKQYLSVNLHMIDLWYPCTLMYSMELRRGAKDAPSLLQLWAPSKGKKLLDKHVEKSEVARIKGAQVLLNCEHAAVTFYVDAVWN